MLKVNGVTPSALLIGEIAVEQVRVGEQLAYKRNLFFPTMVSPNFHDANGNVTTTTGRQNRFAQVDGGIDVANARNLLFTWDALITGSVKPAFRVTFFSANGTFISPRQLVQITSEKSWRCIVPENAERMFVQVDDVSATAKVGFVSFRINKE